MIPITKANWELIQRIHQQVNQDISPADDLETFGQADFWSVVDGKGFGDCDNYALTKRSRLMKAGFDWKDLRITTCFTHRSATGLGGYHAVLIINTDKGEFVACNLHADVVPHDQPGYYYHLIQDPEQKTGWTVCIGQRISTLPLV